MRRIERMITTVDSKHKMTHLPDSSEVIPAEETTGYSLNAYSASLDACSPSPGIDFARHEATQETSPVRPPLSLRVGMASKRGPRQKNDDFCAISIKHDFFAVSDGIGGAPYGDVISRIACNAAIDGYDATGDMGKAFVVANEESSKVSKYLGEHSGATLLLAGLLDDEFEFASVGDSLAYRLRDGVLKRAMNPGRVSETSNALTKAVGYGPIDPDISRICVQPNDRLILCSDGVWEYLKEAELVDLLGTGDNAPLIAESICRRAATVGNDNSTCICIIVEEAAIDGEHVPSAPCVAFAAVNTPSVMPPN